MAFGPPLKIVPKAESFWTNYDSIFRKDKNEEQSPAPNTPRKFRKKPVVISAHQFLPDQQAPSEWPIGVYHDALDGLHYVDTLEGRHVVTPTDWVITGIAGEKYPCKISIFEQTYEPVEE